MRDAVVAVVLLLAPFVNGKGQADRHDQFPELKGPYLGQDPPDVQPLLFAPGIVSTDLHDDFSPAFTPDGREAFFRCLGNDRMIILHSTLDSGRWSPPKVAPFSGVFGDLGVFVSHDGNRLFFSSNRPARDTDTTGDLDLFAVDRTAEGWGDPYCVFPSNSGSGDLLACSIDSAGTVYFYAKNSEGLGGFDLYRLRAAEGLYSSKETLPTTINTRRDETCPCIARDGSFLIYSSQGGANGNDGTGLYVAFLNPDQSWSRPVNLSRHLGMTLPAKFPGLSPDGRYLFFVVPESKEANRRLGRKWEIEALRGAGPRAGGGNVYWVNISVLDDLRSEK